MLEAHRKVTQKDNEMPCKDHIDRYKLECTARIAAGFLAAYILSIAYLPRAVPPSLRVNITVINLSLYSIPLVQYTILGAIPGLLLAVFLILVFGTALMAAAAVADWVLIVVYAAYAYWTTSVHFGKNLTTTWGRGQNLIAVPALMVLSLRPIFDDLPVNDKAARLSLVAQLWKQRGVDNDLAVIRNILIVSCWSILIIVGTICIPPCRTVRKTIGFDLLPSAVKQASAYLRGKIPQSALVGVSAILKRGQIARLTLFEPPGTCCSSHSFLVDELCELTSAVDDVILGAIAMDYTDNSERDDSAVEQITKKLDEIAISLATTTTKGMLIDTGEETSDLEGNITAMHRILWDKVNVLYTVALHWQSAILASNETTKSQMTASNIVNTCKKKLPIWLVTPFLGWPKTMMLDLIRFHRIKQWNLRRILWRSKRTAGAVLLMCMVVYWPAYANFAINASEWKVGAIYYGWDIIGYANSWRTTCEGTVKKGLQRFLGVCVGAAFSVLGIIICGGSVGATEPSTNPYGLVGYLTIVTSIMAYASIKSGIKARFTITYESRYFWLYSLLNTGLLAVEHQFGSGSISGLAVNRIVATGTGVLMAWCIAFIPPFVCGSSPEHSRDCMDMLRGSFTSLLRTFLDSKKWNSLDESTGEDQFLRAINDKHKFAAFALKDASMYDNVLRKLVPSLASHHKLDPFLKEIRISITYLSDLLLILREIEGSGETSASLHEYIESLLNSGSPSACSGSGMGIGTDEIALDEAKMLIGTIYARLGEHEATLSLIEAEAKATSFFTRVAVWSRWRRNVKVEKEQVFEGDMALELSD